jgi:hypothetical protein
MLEVLNIGVVGLTDQIGLPGSNTKEDWNSLMFYPDVCLPKEELDSLICFLYDVTRKFSTSEPALQPDLKHSYSSVVQYFTKVTYTGWVGGFMVLFI